MITYIIEFSLLLGVLGIANILLVRHSGRYNFRRKYLIISTVISLILPLVPVIPTNTNLVFSELLPIVEIVTGGIKSTQPIAPGEQGVSLLTIVSFLYGIVSFFFLFKFARAAFIINTILKNNETVIIDQNRIVYARAIKNPCSFFKTILLPAERIFSDNELQAIVKHENIHIDLDHTVEKIFFEFLKIICWWHPVSWYYIKEIELVHELQVDEQMEQKMNPIQYKEILLQLIIYPPHLRLAHSFSSNIKKRIQTMNQKKKKFNQVQLFSICAILCMVTFLIHSCAEPTDKQDVPKINKKIVDANPVKNDPYEIIISDTLTTYDYDTKKETVETTESKGLVYITPDKMPMFPGCDVNLSKKELKECSNTNLLKYIYTNLVYPVKSKDAGIEGMVVVKFIVSTSGFIYKKEYLKSPDEHLRNAVDNMLNKMNEEHVWIPGEHNGEKVAVEYILPVKFKLEG